MNNHIVMQKKSGKGENNMKKILSLLVAFCLLFGLVPAAFAKTEAPAETKELTTVASWDFETDAAENGWIFTDACLLNTWPFQGNPLCVMCKQWQMVTIITRWLFAMQILNPNS